MSKTHTPGPWKAQGTDIWGDGRVHFRVATVHASSSRLNGIDHEANARLIAAAPELLEAAKAYLEVSDHKPGYGDIEEALSSAIAKAEGEL